MNELFRNYTPKGSICEHRYQCSYEDFLMQIAVYSVIREALQKQIDVGTIDYLYPSDSSRALLNHVCLFLCSLLLSIAL